MVLRHRPFDTTRPPQLVIELTDTSVQSSALMYALQSKSPRSKTTMVGRSVRAARSVKQRSICSCNLRMFFWKVKRFCEKLCADGVGSWYDAVEIESRHLGSSQHIKSLLRSGSCQVIESRALAGAWTASERDADHLGQRRAVFVANLTWVRPRRPRCIR